MVDLRAGLAERADARRQGAHPAAHGAKTKSCQVGNALPGSHRPGVCLQVSGADRFVVDADQLGAFFGGEGAAIATSKTSDQGTAKCRYRASAQCSYPTTNESTTNTGSH